MATHTSNQQRRRRDGRFDFGNARPAVSASTATSSRPESEVPSGELETADNRPNPSNAEHVATARERLGQSDEASRQPKRKFYRTSDGRSLLTEGSFKQRERIAQDPEAGEPNLSFLARDRDSKWIEKVRKEEVLVADRAVIHTGNWYTEETVHDLREHIPNNPGVTPEISRYLASRPEPYLAHAVLNGEHVDDATKNHVATTHKRFGVRSHGATLGCLTSDSVAALAVDPDWRVAWAVAERDDIPLSVEPHLAQHPNSQVRRAFARTANSPEALKTLKSDDERSVRRRATRRLRKLSK